MAKAKGRTTARTSAKSEKPEVEDDFYRQLRRKVTDWADKGKIEPAYRDYLLLVPDLFHFLCRAVMDKRVTTTDKAWLGVALAYVLSPVDVLPDFLGPIGLVDDLIVMVIVLDSVLTRIPAGVVKQHWAGRADLYDVVREALGKADGWVGKRMLRRIRNWLQAQGLWGKATPATTPPVPAPTTRTKAATREKTPSRRPARKAAKKTTKKTAKKTTRKTAKKATKKKAAKKATKEPPAKRTIAAKKRGRSSGGGSAS